ncbi:MAG: hypothetical protein H6506_01810 [Calditrichaeota bacterium]|nr:hypothetical protein [Calditrichota bacterium]
MDRAGAKGGCSSKCQFMVNSYEDLHYDILNIARQEVSMGYETLVALRDTTKDTKYVSANLIETKTGKPLFDPYVIRDFGNMRVGVMGLLRDADFPVTSSLVDSTVMRVTNTRDAAKQYLPELFRKTDAVVLLCELPTDDIDSLVADFPDLDMVISTGALRTGETATVLGKKTHVLGTGSSGYNGHYATLEFQPSWGDSVGFADFKDALLEAYDVPGEWADRLASFENKPPTPGNVQPANSGIKVAPNQDPTKVPTNQAPATNDDHSGHSHG